MGGGNCIFLQLPPPSASLTVGSILILVLGLILGLIAILVRALILVLILVFVLILILILVLILVLVAYVLRIIHGNALLAFYEFIIRK